MHSMIRRKVAAQPEWDAGRAPRGRNETGYWHRRHDEYDSE
jgi:predicted dithiol-disulfide oxidoreductase (DUF899 family)